MIGSRVAPLGILLSLLSGLAWAGLDSQRKALGTKIGSLPLLVVLALGQAPVFLAWALATHARATPGYVLPALGSLAINVAANLLFLRAVQLSALSKTVPFLAFTPVFAALNALVLLGELPSTLAWFGIGCVGAGGVLLALAPGHTLLEALRKDPGAWRMLLVALLWSVSSSLDKLALRHATVPLHAAVQTGGVGLVAVSALAFRRRLGELRPVAHELRRVALTLAFAFTALAIQFVALRLVFVGLMEASKRAVGTVMALVLGRLLFDEPITRRKALAAFAIVVGTFLLLG